MRAYIQSISMLLYVRTLKVVYLLAYILYTCIPLTCTLMYNFCHVAFHMYTVTVHLLSVMFMPYYFAAAHKLDLESVVTCQLLMLVVTGGGCHRSLLLVVEAL